MNLTYVVPDLHGRFDLLCEALERILAHAAGRAGTVGREGASRRGDAITPTFGA